MFSSVPNLTQWTELGEQLSGPNAECVREDALRFLVDLERRAERELASPEADATRTQALLGAIETAKTLVTTLFRPVDLSSL